MGMTETFDIIEKETMKESALHSLDGRVKLIFLILIIVYAVFSTQIIVLAALRGLSLIIDLFIDYIIQTIIYASIVTFTLHYFHYRLPTIHTPGNCDIYTTTWNSHYL